MDILASVGPVIQSRIVTARLVLRPLREADLAWVCEACEDFEVSKWLTMVAHPYTMADAQEFLAMDRAGELGTLWVIEHSDALQGVVSIGRELGYWLARPGWGRGIMTEAGHAAVSAQFSGSDADEILSSHFEGNHGSRRVMEKLGFEDVGGHVHHSKARQTEVPGRAMRLSRAKWRTMTAS